MKKMNVTQPKKSNRDERLLHRRENEKCSMINAQIQIEICALHLQ